MKFLKENLLPLITISLGTLFQIFFLFGHNILFLITNSLPDDAFYYFQPARNIVNGCGSTMDCVNITNGYHPLWMLVLLPIFKMFSIGGTNDIVPIYAALLVAIIFSSIAAFVLFRILARFTNNSKIISFALFVYLFNPNLLYNVLNGLETSLVLMFLSLFIFMLIKVQEHVTTQKLITLGVIEGLLALSRLDMVIVVFFGNLFLLQNFLKIDWRQSINYFFISSLTSAIVFLSWAIYNFKTFGMYLTSASITSTFINHRLTYSDNGGYSLGLFIKTILYMLERATQQIVSDSGAPVILLSVFGIGVYYAFKKLVMIDFRNYKSFRLSPVIFVTLGLLALVFVSRMESSVMKALI
jgi:4-amino-4-deoxy-L-arabinose transferase-like glycosyltransferase